MDTKQPEALRLANLALQVRYNSTPAEAYFALTAAAGALRNLHAENETLRAGYDTARLEIASLQARVQELGKAARDVNSRRVQELEAQLAAVAAPKKWAPEEVADGGRGIRWVTNEGVHGRPTDHDVREYLERTPTANGCHCDDCKRFYAAASDVTAAPAQVQAMLAAVPRNAPLYSPDDVAFPVQRSADGTDVPPELASIAKQASIAAVEVAAPIAPAREPLTDEQIDEIHLANSDAYERGDVEYESHGFARAIEHHHGITAAQKGGQYAD